MNVLRGLIPRIPSAQELLRSQAGRVRRQLEEGSSGSSGPRADSEATTVADRKRRGRRLLLLQG